jgi:Mg2+ and Co2+ transporter CorA
MSTDTLKRFRKGLADGEFTMTEIADATGIPLTTLSDMKDAEWRPKVLDRLDTLDAVMTRLERKRTAKPKRGEASATA